MMMRMSSAKKAVYEPDGADAVSPAGSKSQLRLGEICASSDIDQRADNRCQFKGFPPRRSQNCP